MSSRIAVAVGLAGLFLVATSCCLCPYAGLTRAKLTVHLVDEKGRPLENLRVCISSRRMRSRIDPWKGAKSYSSEGRTDSRGRFSATSWTIDRLGVFVKGGHYHYDTDFWVGLPGTHLYDDWLPYSRDITVVLRRVVKPIPMYAKRLNNERLPVHGEPVGFDLAKGDWVKPHGDGEHADLQFIGRVGPGSDHPGSSLTMSVPGRGNGLIPIAEDKVYKTGRFRLPRQAPEASYGLSEVVYRWVAPYNKNRNCVGSVPEKHFFVRVRSGLRANGKLDTAQYAKLIGPVLFGVSPGQRVRVYFSYCLNPTPNDRNLEFADGRNLLKGLAPGDAPLVY